LLYYIYETSQWCGERVIYTNVCTIWLVAIQRKIKISGTILSRGSKINLLLRQVAQVGSSNISAGGEQVAPQEHREKPSLDSGAVDLKSPPRRRMQEENNPSPLSRIIFGRTKKPPVAEPPPGINPCLALPLTTEL